MADKLLSIKGLDKADVLAALYNASRPLGMGGLQYDPKPMSREEAMKLLERSTGFEYLKGRVMKINLSGDEIDARLYDRDNGEGAAERVVTELRKGGNPDAEAFRGILNVMGNLARDVAKIQHEETSYRMDEDTIAKLAEQPPSKSEESRVFEINLPLALGGAFKRTKEEDMETAQKRIGADLEGQLMKVAEGDKDAYVIAQNLHTFWTKINPAINRNWHELFAGYAGSERYGVDFWYRNREPLRLLQENGITGRAIVGLYESYGRDLRLTYLDIALGKLIEKVTQDFLSPPR